MIDEWIESSDLRFDAESGVWLKPNLPAFAYSDGGAAERYVARAIESVEDCSSDSYELERFICDWPSRYHLTRRRANLLQNFDFDANGAVLEIGSGCGAITRFLGETFAHVLGIEGSLRRARTARARTRDLSNVALVCAPFQELRFAKKFDVVFVIGVLEYAARFGGAVNDPYDDFLRRCRELLTKSGTLVLAIENQFGLQYFAGMGEDHTGKPFDGLEGYARTNSEVRTFGRDELEQRLSRHFGQVRFYYPFPDYKLPTAVLSDEAFTCVNPGGLIGAQPIRDHVRPSRQKLFDHALVWEELLRNHMAPLFAPSFLVTAGADSDRLPPFRGLAAIYSSDRRPEFQTVTTVARAEDGTVHTRKVRRHGSVAVNSGPLAFIPVTQPWHDEPSLTLILRRRCRRRGASLRDVFAPCAPWFAWLKSTSHQSGGRDQIDGTWLDATWKNTLVRDGRIVFIDQEWSWHEPIDSHVLVIRSIYDFLNDEADIGKAVSALTRVGRGAEAIARIAALFDVRLSNRDFEAFVRMESEVQHIVFGAPRALLRQDITLKLRYPRIRGRLAELRRLADSTVGRQIAGRLPSSLRTFLRGR